MKRFYYSIALLLLCITWGIVDMKSIEFTSDKCLSEIQQIDTEVDSNKFHNALKICKRTNKNFSKLNDNLLFYYFNYTILESIENDLAIMEQTLKNKDVKNYSIISAKTKKQLRTIKDEELLKIQNIL